MHIKLSSSATSQFLLWSVSAVPRSHFLSEAVKSTAGLHKGIFIPAASLQRQHTRLTNTSPGLNNREICSKSGNALWARRQRRDLTLSPPSCRSALRAEMIHSSLHIWSRCECWKAAASGGETNPEKTDPSSVHTAESELHYERDKSTTSISNMD